MVEPGQPCSCVHRARLTLITQFDLITCENWVPVVLEFEANREKNLLVTSVYGTFLLRSALKSPTAFRKQQSEEHSWVGDAVPQKNIRSFLIPHW